MTLEQFKKLERGDILISPMGSEIVVARVERKRAHKLSKALVTKKALMQGGSVVDAKNFHNWQRKGSLFGDAE